MELRIALLVFGLLIVLIVALLTYNRTRLVRLVKGRTEGPRDQEEREPFLVPEATRDADAVMTSQSTGAVSRSAVRAGGQDRQDPRLHRGWQDVDGVAAKPADVDGDPSVGVKEQFPDDKIDFVASLPISKAVTRDEVLGIYRQHEYLLEKPRRIYGWNIAGKVWRDLETEPESGEYSDLRLAIQLADHVGPASESELNKFAQTGLRMAEKFGCPLKFSMTFEEARERAQNLDEFCRTYDALAILNIAADDEAGFQGGVIEREANKQGMQLGSMNIFHRKNRNARGAPYLFSLANLYKPGEFDRDKLDTFRTQGLTLFMNIPCTYHPARVFQKMVEVGKGFCDALGGTLFDQDRKRLDDAALHDIACKIKNVAAEMEGKGVVPGSDTALRLF